MANILDDDHFDARHKQLITDLAEQVRSVGDIRSESANEGHDVTRNASASKLCYDLSKRILKSVNTDRALDFSSTATVRDELPQGARLDIDERIRLYIAGIGVDNFPKTANQFYDALSEVTIDVLLSHFPGRRQPVH